MTRNRTFLAMASMVVTWRIVAFLRRAEVAGSKHDPIKCKGVLGLN